MTSGSAAWDLIAAAREQGMYQPAPDEESLALGEVRS